MSSDNKLREGQVVRSLSGRDKGRVFLVYEILDDNNVLIVDGDLRRLDKPKRKRLKHLSVYKTVLPELKYKKENNFNINNAYIRKLLEPFE